MRRTIVWKQRRWRGYTAFYDCTAPTRREAEQGTWVYVPRARESPAASSCFFLVCIQGENANGKIFYSLNSAPSRRAGRDGGPAGQPIYGERGECEVPTKDNCVDPDTLDPLPRPSRRQRRAVAAGRSGGQGKATFSTKPGAAARIVPGVSGLHDSPLTKVTTAEPRVDTRREMAWWNTSGGSGLVLPPGPACLRPLGKKGPDLGATGVLANKAAMALHVSLKGKAEESWSTAS